MKEKDVELFNKLIHNLKKVIYDIKEEREFHNKKLNKMFKEAKETLDEAYTLFDDLYSDGDNKKPDFKLMKKEYVFEKCEQCESEGLNQIVEFIFEDNTPTIREVLCKKCMQNKIRELL
ncbi:MAG: hypothetical protein ACFFAU_01505 [Candidatus Hodarchaeota archaeon]